MHACLNNVMKFASGYILFVIWTLHTLNIVSTVSLKWVCSLSWWILHWITFKDDLHSDLLWWKRASDVITSWGKLFQFSFCFNYGVCAFCSSLLCVFLFCKKLLFIFAGSNFNFNRWKFLNEVDIMKSLLFNF